MMNKIVEYYNTLSEVEYSEIANTFEFNTNVYLGNRSPNAFKPLIKHIGDNIPHFIMIYSVYTSTRFGCIFLGTGADYKGIEVLLELEELKRSYNPTIRYTLLENMLELYRGKTKDALKNDKIAHFNQVQAVLDDLQESVGSDQQYRKCLFFICVLNKPEEIQENERVGER